MTPEVQTNMEVEDGEIVGSLSNESATVKTQTETETHVLDLQKEKENEQSPMSGNDDRVLIDIAEENLVSPKVTEESKSEEVGPDYLKILHTNSNRGRERERRGAQCSYRSGRIERN
ncbi:hypothetical protein Rs2_41458 [Raphanus sativus]|nr:hypothetical protein Rs2_41458 [Raphanus sativus]